MHDSIHILKRRIKSAIGIDIFFTPSIAVHTERLGSKYGGWSLVTDKLSPASVVLSLGVGNDISFDLAIIERFGSTVHAFDPTPASIDWIKEQALPRGFVFHPFGISDMDGELRFHLPRNPNHVSHSIFPQRSKRHKFIEVPVKRISTFLSEQEIEFVDVLKMDIEGAEYQVISDFLSHPILPKQVLIEFHHRLRGIDVAATRQSVNQLLNAGYEISAVSSTGQEISFLHSCG